MCAIFGICGENNKPLLEKISKSQYYRGPDSQNFFLDETNKVNLGSNRLAVVDAIGGSQPMKLEEDNYVIVFNGCIYNFNTIKKFLKKKNVEFASESDTEVLLKAYLFFGEKCFNYFDGMWSCAIYNKKEKSLLLSRDYLGQKPLYYFCKDKKFIFSSELNGILEDTRIKVSKNKIGIAKYFFHGFFPAPYTPYDQILQVQPGELIKIDLSNFKIVKKIYWDVTNGPDYNIFFKKNNEKDFPEIFAGALKNHSIADQETALTLSGGIDSFLVSYFFIKLHGKGNSFSLGFDEKSFDETDVINKINLDLNKNIFKKGFEDYKFALKKILNQKGELVGDSSIVPTYLLFSHIKKTSNVALTGDGGDENFYGYLIFDGYKLCLFFKKFIPNFIFNLFLKFFNFFKTSHEYMSFTKKIKTFLKGIVYEQDLILANWISPLSINDIEKNLNLKINKDFFFKDIKEMYIKNNDKMKFAQKYMIKYYLPTILIKIDQASMHNSVEARAPFLSKTIINFSLDHDSKKLYKTFKKKFFLKKIFKKIIPDYILNAKKHGFAFQKEKILNDKKFIFEMIRNQDLSNSDFFYDKYEKFKKNDGDYSNYLWHELVLNNFFKNHDIKDDN